MKLIVGLGNPGNKYKNTRHNVGFMILDELVGSVDWQESKKGKTLYYWLKVNDEEIEALKPQTFMNKSGQAVAYAKKKHPQLTPEDIVIIHDDLDIPLGKVKLQQGKGPREHKGVKSVEDHLKTTAFWRLRVGVDNRKAGNREIPGEEYVLKPFPPPERSLINQTIKQAADALINHFKK